MSRRGARRPFSLFSFQDLVTGLSGVMILLVLTMALGAAARSGVVRTDPLDDTAEEEAALRAETEAFLDRLAALKAEADRTRLAVRDAPSAEAAEAAREAVRVAVDEADALRAQVEALVQRLEAVRKADAESKRVLAEMETTRRNLEARLDALRKRPGVTLIAERGNLKAPVYVVCGGGGMTAYRPLDGGAPSAGETLDGEEELEEYLDALDRRTHTVVLLVRPSGAGKMRGAADAARRLGFAVGRDPLEEAVEVAFAEAGGAE